MLLERGKKVVGVFRNLFAVFAFFLVPAFVPLSPFLSPFLFHLILQSGS